MSLPTCGGSIFGNNSKVWTRHIYEKLGSDFGQNQIGMDRFFFLKKKKKKKKMHIGHKYGIATKFWPKFWHFGFAGSSKDVSENLQAPSNYGCTRLV